MSVRSSEGYRTITCNCFLSVQRSHILQADTGEAYVAWITALQQAIGAAIQRGMSKEGANSDTFMVASSQNDEVLLRRLKKSKSR